MLQRLEFASCYVYTKQGTSDAARKSVDLRDRVKRGDAQWLPRYAGRVAALFRDGGWFASWFGPETTLVPVPGSAPTSAGGLWVPERIAAA